MSSLYYEDPLSLYVTGNVCIFSGHTNSCLELCSFYVSLNAIWYSSGWFYNEFNPRPWNAYHKFKLCAGSILETLIKISRWTIHVWTTSCLSNFWLVPVIPQSTEIYQSYICFVVNIYHKSGKRIYCYLKATSTVHKVYIII